MLLTRPPLDGESKSEIVQALNLQWAISFDLHVLGMPPAFILSQDQTLKNIFILFCLFFLATQIILTFCSVFKDHFFLCFTKVFYTCFCLVFVKCNKNIPHPDNHVNIFFYFFCFFLIFLKKSLFLLIFSGIFNIFYLFTSIYYMLLFNFYYLITSYIYHNIFLHTHSQMVLALIRIVLSNFLTLALQLCLFLLNNSF